MSVSTPWLPEITPGTSLPAQFSEARIQVHTTARQGSRGAKPGVGGEFRETGEEGAPGKERTAAKGRLPAPRDGGELRV